MTGAPDPDTVPPILFVCDVGALRNLDEAGLDALVRLELAARRIGGSIALRNARGELIDLLELVGLREVIREEG